MEKLKIRCSLSQSPELLADIVGHLSKVLDLLDKLQNDMGYGSGKREWRVMKMSAGSPLIADLEQPAIVAEPGKRFARALLGMVKTASAPTDEGAPEYSDYGPDTIQSFMTLARTIDGERTMTFDVIGETPPEILDTCKITSATYGGIRRLIRKFVTSTGSTIQGKITEFHIEGNSPYLWVRELATARRTKVMVPLALYGQVAALIENKETVAYFSGTVLLDFAHGITHDMTLKHVEAAPQLQPGDIEQFMGAIPDMTGDLSVVEYMQRMRNGD
ncbi:MAG: hypothetical protein WC712_10765 [Candidatus Brocadiia bacterium]